MEPEIFVNFKHYENAVGKSCEELLKDFNTLKNKNIYYCLSPIDLRLKTEFTSLNIFSQTVDANGYGAYTGSISMESLIDIGVNGSLLNHSERRMAKSDIIKIIEKSKKLDFKIVLCVESLDEVREYSKYDPEYIAYEPPELIGGDISVSNAKPGIIKNASEISNDRNIKLLVGAGVKTYEDVKNSMNLGAYGVLIASGIIKNPKPINKLISLGNL